MSPLRDADAYNHAKFRSTLTESSHQAIFQDGTISPVLIRGYDTGKPEIYVETDDYQFVDPRQLRGFVRLEETPTEKAWQAEQTKKAESDAARAAKPQNLAEAKMAAEQTVRDQMGWRYTNRQPDGVAASSKWVAFAEAGRRARNERFTSR